MLRSAFLIARLEARAFLRYPKLLLAAVVVVLIPALYVVIYLSSVWDPASHTGALPVAIVNLDRGLEYRQQSFNMGREVTQRLKEKPAFGYVDLRDEQEARGRVQRGELAFALIVPSDFSSNAIPGAQAGAGKLVVYTSEGNSYPTAGLARRFADELGREVNQSLNEQRWALVLSDAAGSQRSFERLHSGIKALRHGAHELAVGTQQLAKGADALSSGSARVDQTVGPLATGAKDLGQGLRSMYDKRAKNNDLKRLEDGAQALMAGQEEMNHVLIQLQQGSHKLHAGVTSFKAEAEDSFFVTDRVKEALGPLSEGVGALDAGLSSAGVGQQKLMDGAGQLQSGVGTLTHGMRTLNAGLRTMVMQLPDDARLEQLAHGATGVSSGAAVLEAASHKLSGGAQHLAGGLDLLESALPASLRAPDGNAKGLANSVQPYVDIVAPVQNNGAGFAPNIIPGALWLGVSMAAFLIHMRTLPRAAVRFSPWTRVAGKIVLPLGLVLLQALLVWACVLWVLQIHVAHAAALAVSLCAASVTFFLIVFALNRAMGDAGKAIALVLLAVQLSSSGGILPVELSGGLFAQMSPYLPITWVVKAIKTCLFDAYAGLWLHTMQQLAVAGFLAAVAACCIGRWRYVTPSLLRPSLDL